MNAEAIGGQLVPIRPGASRLVWRFPANVGDRALPLFKPTGRNPIWKYVEIPCETEECKGVAKNRGLCSKCYRRWHYENHERKRRGYTKREPKPIGATSLHNGYVLEKVSADKWQLQHRLVMERHLGRTLFPEETVHHKNLDQTDNVLTNLELWSSRHPKGARVEDLVEYAREILSLYGKEMP